MKTINFEYQPNSDKITIEKKPGHEIARRRGLRGGVIIGAAGALAVAGIGGKAVDAFHDHQLKGEFSQTDYFNKLAHDSENGFDPRTVGTIEADAAANPTGFQPYSTVLKDGTRVTIEQTQTGQTPSSIAAELAPSLNDRTYVEDIITKQAAIEGDSSRLQPDALVVIPDKLIGK